VQGRGGLLSEERADGTAARPRQFSAVGGLDPVAAHGTTSTPVSRAAICASAAHIRHGAFALKPRLIIRRRAPVDGARRDRGSARLLSTLFRGLATDLGPLSAIHSSPRH